MSAFQSLRFASDRWAGRCVRLTIRSAFGFELQVYCHSAARYADSAVGEQGLTEQSWVTTETGPLAREAQKRAANQPVTMQPMEEADRAASRWQVKPEFRASVQGSTCQRRSSTVDRPELSLGADHADSRAAGRAHVIEHDLHQLGRLTEQTCAKDR